MNDITITHEVDTYTVAEADRAATRRSILHAGGRVISSAPIDGGYIIRAAYPR
jgi:hypothetical protein